MSFLFLSIFFSVILFLVFKLMAVKGVPTLDAIVVNYGVCVLQGMIAGILSGHDNLSGSAFILPGVILGAMFITVFYWMAVTVRIDGIAVATIASKLSLVIPVAAAWYLYGDHFNAGKIAGICLALIAVVLIIYRKYDDKHQALRARSYLFPLAVLIGSGCIDAGTKYNQQNFLGRGDNAMYLVTVFGTAGIIGVLVLFSRYLLQKRSFSRRSISYGIMLGIPNYWTLYFLLNGLEDPHWESSAFIPANNIGTVLLSCIAAWLLFRERISRLNAFGIVLAICSIVLILDAWH